MKKIAVRTSGNEEEMFLVAPAAHAPLALPGVLDPKPSNLLQRMFRDPSALESQERGDLIASLRAAVDMQPGIPEIRVLLGMVLCVDWKAQEALEELRESVNLAPNCFIAQLKLGELLMRLRICDQAAEHTQHAVQLASNDVQAELARKQATAIRTMRREGIERGGYKALLPKALRFRRKSALPSTAPVLAGSK
jgi:tetratricopeptide (TPR) repeat protein